MTVLNILNERSEFSILCEGFIRGHKVQSTRGQVSIRILRYYVIKAAVSFVKFFLPLLGKDNRMGNNNPYPPLPSLIREGADISHSEALRGETIQPIENNKQNTCGNASLIPPYVLEVKGSKGVDENQPSPQPSPIGEGVSNSHPELVSGSHLVQQQVKHHANSLKRTYSLINLFSYSPHKKAAFTLAEVLITLGIIGIVAAMTMPILVAKYREKLLVNQAKTAYSKLSNALIMVKVHNGYNSYADFMYSISSEDEMLDIICNELKVVKKCKKNEKGCFTWLTKYANKQINNNGQISYQNFQPTSSAILADGTVISVGNLITEESKRDCTTVRSYQNSNGDWVSYSDDRCGHIIVDVNGKKLPNQLGADTFDFGITENNLNARYPFFYNDELNYEHYNLN